MITYQHMHQCLYLRRLCHLIIRYSQYILISYNSPMPLLIDYWDNESKVPIWSVNGRLTYIDWENLLYRHGKHIHAVRTTSLGTFNRFSILAEYSQTNNTTNEISSEFKTWCSAWLAVQYSLRSFEKWLGHSMIHIHEGHTTMVVTFLATHRMYVWVCVFVLYSQSPN